MWHPLPEAFFFFNILFYFHNHLKYFIKVTKQLSQRCLLKGTTYSNIVKAVDKVLALNLEKRNTNYPSRLRNLFH